VHDRILQHKRKLFDHLTDKWKDLFGATFAVLLYDLTSTSFEIDAPDPEHTKKRFGYSRDKRPDGVQIIIALVVTPEGFPLAYEVLAGNTSDKTTPRDFLKKIEDQYGQARRIRVMDQALMTSPPGSGTLAGCLSAVCLRASRPFGLSRSWPTACRPPSRPL
jgi:hypothetical protein